MCDSRTHNVSIIVTDCIGRCKYIHHMIMATTAHSVNLQYERSVKCVNNEEKPQQIINNAKRKSKWSQE